MIRGDLVRIRRAGCAEGGVAIPRENGERWIREYPDKWGILRIEPNPWYLEPVGSCSCYGAFALGNRRCSNHQDRNPCAVEGCRRTIAANGRLADDQSICGTHWRRFVPPGSAERRTYNRFWRLAKRHGWAPPLRCRFHRFWDALVARIRRRATEGFVDQREIERLFGWKEAA